MVTEDVRRELLELARSLGVESEISTALPELEIQMPSSISESTKDTSQYRIPANGQKISGHHPVSQGGFATPTHSAGHYGWDIGNNIGTPVYAIGPGIVIRIYNENDNPKGGNAVKISHENGKVTSYYAHLNEVNVGTEEIVDQNTQIGTIGTSGMIYNGVKRNTSPHLHFQVQVNDTDIDPGNIVGVLVGKLSSTASSNVRLTKIADRFTVNLSAIFKQQK